MFISFLDQTHDGLDGNAACYFAGFVASHTISQYQQADVVVDTDRVFIVLAHLADIA